MTSILLIGGTGVLSSAVVQEALRKNIDVTIVTRGNRNIPEGMTSIVCDKENYEMLSVLLEGKTYDAIIDFLCFTNIDVERSFNFYSHFTNQYFFISSCAVYDTRLGGVCDENAPKVLPMWSYSINKWTTEEKLMELTCKSSCHYTIIRPSVTYDDTRIPYGISPIYGYHWTLCARILAEKPIITWNNGENRCNMMRVEDFAVGVVGLIGNEKAYNEAFNICGDETPSFREVLSVVEEYLGKKATTVNVTSEFYAEQIPYRAGELLGGRAIDSINSNEKIKLVVPEFKQAISIKEGLHKTLDAYIKQNYECGIDWTFDAETDRTIYDWCKTQGIPTRQYNLGFVDYLHNSTIKDKCRYYSIFYHDRMWMKTLVRLRNVAQRILSHLK